MKKLWATVDENLFRYGSPVSIGVFRIVFSCLLMFNWILLLPHVKNWFTEQGYVPVSSAQGWNGTIYPRFNPLGDVTNPMIIYVFYGLLMVVTLMTMVGYKTRIASILLAIGVVSLHMRNPIILHGGDTLMRVFTILLAISPCGAAVSLDRKFAVAKGTAPAQPPDISIWPQRLMQWQLAVIYITTVWDKWQGFHWKDGTATWYAMNLPEFHRLPVPGFMQALPAVMFTTYATLLIELSMGTLVFSRPLRNWVLISGLLLHASLEYMFNIPMFQLCITSVYIVHLDGEEWVRAYERFKARRSTATSTA